MYKNFDEFIQASKESIDLFNSWVGTHRLSAVADHICYKCSSSEEFESMRELLESHSLFMYQSIISQRRIAVIKLLRSISSALGDIWYLELADQKPDGSQTSGFDHIEIYPTDSLDALVISLETQGIELKKVARPHHTTFDIAIGGNFKVRLEQELLIEKIKREEME